MTALPSGIVTFLFTDIEKSTQWAGTLGDHRWAALLAEHQRRLRVVFHAHSGHEVHTEGDAFFVVFEHAEHALTAAVAGQRSLASHAWPDGGGLRVRMGVHTGRGLLRDRDYVGYEVHLAKRICDAAHGGQVLVSSSTADLVRRQLPGDLSLTSLGHHRLKDLRDAQHLLQLCDARLPQQFPAPRSVGPARTTLPAPRSALVGREAEVAHVTELITAHRLVTLTGVGGCGKTRLAVEVANGMLGTFRDGAIFVELAPISDPSVVAPAVANASNIVIGDAPATSSAVEALIEGLASRRCLLLLDNCEHLLDAASDLAERIIDRCPGVAVCATSREPLGVAGEQVYRVPSLGVPTDDSQIATAEAVRLFAVRAQAAHSGFSLSPANRVDVAHICRRLDGIPLAIEFAAARITHLSPRQIAERLDDVFLLLTGGRRRIPRQQTLEATLDWSHDLLADSERVLFRRLAVFSGTFDLACTERVCVDELIPARAVVDLLRSLVSKSLVISEYRGDEVRYRLLETVRAYAAQRLRAAEESEALRDRHSDWYVNWLEAFPLANTVLDGVTIGRLTQELGNIRVAADWAIARARPDLLARLACRTLGLWWLGDRSEVGHQWLQKVIQHPEKLSSAEQLGCYSVLSFTSALRTDGAALEHASRAIELARGRPSGYLVVALGQRALMLAISAVMTRDDGAAAEARRTAAAGIATARAGLEKLWLAYAHQMRGQVELSLRDERSSVDSFGQAVEACEMSEEFAVIAAWAHANLSVAHHVLGEHEKALRAAQRAETHLERISGYLLRIIIPLETVPSLAAGGARDAAYAKMQEALRDTTRTEPLYVNALLILTGTLAFLAGAAERAGRLLATGRHVGAAAQLAVPFSSPPNAALYRYYVPLVRAALGVDGARRAAAEGREMTSEQAVAYALETLDAIS